MADIPNVTVQLSTYSDPVLAQPYVFGGDHYEFKSDWLPWSAPPAPLTFSGFDKLFHFAMLPLVRLEHDWQSQWIKTAAGLMVEAQIPHFSPTLEHAVVLKPNTPTIEPGSRGWVYRNGVWQPEPKVFSVLAKGAFKWSDVEWSDCGPITYTFTAPAGWTFWPPSESSPVNELENLVPALNHHKQVCPQRRRCSQRGQTVTLRNLIIHLNDDHKWSRERIADWLETLDVDLTLKAASSGN